MISIAEPLMLSDGTVIIPAKDSLAAKKDSVSPNKLIPPVLHSLNPSLPLSERVLMNICPLPPSAL